MFHETIMNIYTITFASWNTERKISNDGRELQVDIGSAQKIISLNYLISVFQTNDTTTPNKANNPARFDTNHVTKYFFAIDGVRYPKGGVLTNFAENLYSDQYRDIKLFYKAYVAEELFQPYISYTDMKKILPYSSN